MDLEKILKSKILKESIVYAFFGFVAMSVDTVLYLIINKRYIDSGILTTTITTSVGITISFLLNYFHNFGVKNNFFKQYLSFYLIGFLGIILTALAIFIFSNILGYDSNLVKVVVVLPVAIIQFTFNKLLSFNPLFIKK